MSEKHEFVEPTELRAQHHVAGADQTMSRREFLEAGTIAALHSILPDTTMDASAATQQDHTAQGTHEKKERHVMSEAEVKSCIAGRIELHRPDEMQRCVDGRGTHATAGVPGGDLGVMIMGLAAAERVTGTLLDRETIRAFLHSRPKIYEHTDSHAEHDLHEAIKQDPVLGQLAQSMGMAQLLRDGTGHADHNHTLAALMRKHCGCGHFKKMMEDHEGYGIRSGLADETIEESFQVGWETKTVTREVLDGDHGEGAVVIVKTKGDLSKPDAQVVTLKPSNGGTQQFFVAAPAVSELHIGQDARNLQAILRQKGVAIDAEQLAATARTYLGTQTNKTVGLLAKGLHIFSVTINPDNCSITDIQDTGTVPEK